MPRLGFLVFYVARPADCDRRQRCLLRLRSLDLISRQDLPSGTSQYYHADGLGSVRNLTDASGAIIGSARYDAVGALRTGTATGDFQFAGQETDPETGLYYLRARYYDPMLGRFTTRDTWSGDTARPYSLNPYLYVEDNPANLVDPSGHETAVIPFLFSFAEDAGIDLSGVIGLGGIAALSSNPNNPIGRANAEAKATTALVTAASVELANALGPSCHAATSAAWQAISKAFPSNPDEWVPPLGVTEEPKAKDNTWGRIRHWIDEAGRIVREWHKGTPGKPGWRGQDHWHDRTGDNPEEHILPGD